MKRTICIMLIAIMAVLTLTSCTTKTQEKTKDYQSLISKNKEEVYTALGVSADKVEEIGRSMFLLPEKENYLDNEFSVILVFDPDDVLYGYWYAKEITEDIPKAVETFDAIVTKLTEEYGDPDTYPGHHAEYTTVEAAIDKLSNADDSEPRGAVFESWNLESMENLVLDASLEKMTNADTNKEHIFMTLKYQIQLRMSGELPTRG